MAQEQTAETPGTGSDLWVAAGVVICLGLGAGMTYWLTSEPAPPPPAQASVAPIRGQSMRAKPTDAKANPTPAAGTTADNAPTEITHGDSDYTSVSFDVLAGYFYMIPDLDKPEATPKDQIPKPIKDYDGKKVAVRGFMVPVSQERGGVKTFLLVRDQSLCCFGRMPRMNEWVSVQMKDNKPTRFISDQVITVFGTIHVGELVEKGVVLSVYRMDAEEVAGPLDL
jgi:hypothetical protein